MSKLEFGVRVPNSGPFAGTKSLSTLAIEAEKLGFHSVWVNDHISWSLEQHTTHVSAGSVKAVAQSKDPNIFESITTLSYLAGLTSSIKLGLSVLILPLRSPIVTAKQIAMIDVLSNGRLILGVGVGRYKEAYENLNVRFEKRGEMLDEYIQAMKQIWTTSSSEFRGKFVSFSESLSVFPKPIQKPFPPLWVGGNGAAAIKRAAKLCNGWIPSSPTPKELSTNIVLLEEELKKNSRNLNGFTVAVDVHANIAKSREQSLDRALGTLKQRHSSDEGTDLSADFIGSPSDWISKIEDYKAKGVSHFQFKLIYDSVDMALEEMKLFSTDVLPNF